MGSLERNRGSLSLRGSPVPIPPFARQHSVPASPPPRARRDQDVGQFSVQGGINAQLAASVVNKMRQQPEPPLVEEIYDFGGDNVKSCAAIAAQKAGLSKSQPYRPVVSGMAASHPSSYGVPVGVVQGVPYSPTSKSGQQASKVPGHFRSASPLQVSSPMGVVQPMYVQQAYSHNMQGAQAMYRPQVSSQCASMAGCEAPPRAQFSPAPAMDAPRQECSSAAPDAKQSPEFDTEQAVERRLLAELARQQHQSEEDRRWLQMQEDNLKRLSNVQLAPPTDGENPDKSEVQQTTSAQENKSSSQPHSAANSSETSPANTVKPKESRTPSEDKGSTNQEPVYVATTSVVRCVMRLAGVATAPAPAPPDLLEAVRAVGAALRGLCATVDSLVRVYPPNAQREVEMAHQVLSKDMAALVEAMRLAIHYCRTTLHHDYTKSMLAAAHVLAMDAKNLLDVVDCIRERHPHVDWKSALQLDDQPHTSSLSPNNQSDSENQVFPTQASTPQNQVLSTQSSVQETETQPKPDFKINQPVTTVTTQLNLSDHVPKEHNSLPITTNRVSTLIHSYNLYGNVREPQHIYGNEGVSFQHSQSCDDSKIDLAPIESVKSRVQAISGKIDSPAIYSVSKKLVPIDQNIVHDQG